MRDDTRTLLKSGSWVLAAGFVCIARMFGVFGGAGIHGPHTNGGWLMLIFALGCVPMGLLITGLGLAKLIGDRTRG